MRLRFVKTVHFGKSELTNFVEVLAKHPEFGKSDSSARLRGDDVVLLVSQTGNQLVFLHGFDVFQDKKVLRSTRLRISGGTRWNPLMLVDYAKEVGIALTGLRAYEDHVRALMKGV